MLSYYIGKLLPPAHGLTINLMNPHKHPILFTVIILALVCIIATIIFFIYKKKVRSNIPSEEMKQKNHNYFGFKKKEGKSNVINELQVEELNKDLQPFGFAYYPKSDIFYSIMNGWQRECGYCELYDEASAALSMIIDCEPIRFEYGGKRWLIEFWKGQYGMNTGCEIGIYNTDGPNLNIPGFFDGTFYSCASDDDHMNLAFSLRKNGTLLFSRSESHWWLTGFKLGEFSYPSELSMNIEITLKCPEMRDAFINAMLEAGYSSKDLYISDTTVSFRFDTPHSPQPLTRSNFTEYIMQTNNQRNCEAFQYATKSYNNTLDKLEYVKIQAPKMYRKILNVGNTKELFGSYKTISDFLNHK